MHAIENKLGIFYLGKTVDPETGKVTEHPLLYDSKDLTTHAVCVGMTGSGKTGLGIVLLEEAAIDGIPAIILDPKGDLGNLLLAFPELKPSEFLPWIDQDEAARSGLTPEKYAENVAKTWKDGLIQWGEDGFREQRGSYSTHPSHHWLPTNMEQTQRYLTLSPFRVNVNT